MTENPQLRLGEDFLGLVDGVQQWAKKTFGELNVEHRPEDCTWCPICQAVALVRGEAPELAEKFTEAANAFAAAMKALLESVPNNQAPRPRPSPRPAAAPSRTAARVHKIDLDDDGDLLG